LALAVVLFFFASTVDSKTIRDEDLFDQSPIFYLKIFPKDVEEQESYYFSRALEYFTVKEHELSIEKLKQLFQAYPKTKYKEYAAFLIADNEFYKAVKGRESYLLSVIHSYQKAIDDYPDSKYAPWAHFQVANCYNRMEYVYEANAKYEDFMNRYPENVHFENVVIYKGELTYGSSKHKETIDVLGKFDERYPDSKYKQVANFFIADSYYRLNDNKRAIEHFGKAKGIEKEYPYKTLYYAEVLIELKKYKEAIYNLTSIINYFPRFSEIEKTYLLLANSFLSLKDFNNAVYNYFYVIRKYPKSDQAVEGRLKIAKIRTMVDENKFSIVMRSSDVDFVLDLKNVFKEVYKTNKDNKYGQLALYELGEIAAKQKNELRAMRIFKKLYDDYPKGKYYKKSFDKFLLYFNRLVKKYNSEKDNVRVAELYQKYKEDIKSSKSKEINDALFSIGESLMELRIYSLAVEVFGRIREDDKSYKSEEVLYLGTYAAYHSKNYKISEELSRELLTKHKDSKYKDKTEYFKAESKYFLGKYKDAEWLLKEYIDKRGEKADDIEKIRIYSDIAESYDKQGNEKEAVSYYKKVLNIAEKYKRKGTYKKIRERAVLRITGLSYVSKNHSDAVKYYGKYFKDKKELTPDDNMHLFYFAKSYQNQNKLDSALFNYKKLLNNLDRGFYAKAAKDEIKYIEFLKKYEDYL
jgi:TolA-binding protein